MRRLMRWLDATPHPTVAIEFTPEQVSAARFTRTGALDGFAVEPLPPGALVPSAIEFEQSTGHPTPLYPPGVADRPRITAPAFLKLRHVVLYPTQNRVCTRTTPRSAIISTTSLVLSLYRRYHRTHKTMIS